VPMTAMVERARRWFYRGGRASRFATALNRVQALAFSAGIQPGRLATLEVRGRRSGRLIRFPVVIAEAEGERYLVAMLGEKANWVRNVDAAGGRAVLRHGRREAVRLLTVPSSQRAPILRRYLERAPGARAHFAVDYRAPLSEFEQIAPQVPVFRVTHDPSSRSDSSTPTSRSGAPWLRSWRGHPETRS
jgi:deazaflavin-dependent oxidoreductase (nitroreductase family)